MADFKVITPKRDIARELARKYSTMTHDELDVVEDILEPIKYGKGEMILPKGEQCMGISYIEKGLVRQFYFKNGKEVTEHLGVDDSIFMCIESLFKEEPTRLQVEALELLWCICYRRRSWRRLLCVMLISRCFIVKYWKRV